MLRPDVLDAGMEPIAAERDEGWPLVMYGNGAEPSCTLDVWVPSVGSMLLALQSALFVDIGDFMCETLLHLATALRVMNTTYFANKLVQAGYDYGAVEFSIACMQSDLTKREGFDFIPVVGQLFKPQVGDERPVIHLHSMYMNVDAMIRPAALGHPSGHQTWACRFRALSTPINSDRGVEEVYPDYGYGQQNWREAFVVHCLAPLGPPRLSVNNGVKLDARRIYPASLLLAAAYMGMQKTPATRDQGRDLWHDIESGKEPGNA